MKFYYVISFLVVLNAHQSHAMKKNGVKSDSALNQGGAESSRAASPSLFARVASVLHHSRSNSADHSQKALSSSKETSPQSGSPREDEPLSSCAAVAVVSEGSAVAAAAEGSNDQCVSKSASLPVAISPLSLSSADIARSVSSSSGLTTPRRLSLSLGGSPDTRKRANSQLERTSSQISFEKDPKSELETPLGSQSTLTPRMSGSDIRLSLSGQS